MKGIVNSVLLVNRDKSHNFLNQYRLLKYCALGNIIKVSNGNEAIDYLTKAKKDLSLKPDLIILNCDLAMMNKSEFFSNFSNLGPKIIRGIKIIILHESLSEEDLKKICKYRNVVGAIKKPLSPSKIDELFHKYFLIDINNQNMK